MSRRIKYLSAVTAVVLSLVLVACVQKSDPPSMVEPTTSSDSRVRDDPAPSPLPPDVEALPLERDCEQILSAQEVYEYNPNVATDPAYSASALAQQVVSYDGVACGWINQTSGVPLSIAVARFSEPGQQAAREAAAAKAGASLLSGEDGYFRVTSSGGVVEAFVGQHWVVIESPAFSVEGDVAALLDTLRASLR